MCSVISRIEPNLGAVHYSMTEQYPNVAVPWIIESIRVARVVVEIDAHLAGSYHTVYLFIPEYSGRTYAQIDEMFLRKVPARRFKTFQCSGNYGRDLNMQPQRA
jgi:hypothetical protein